MVASLLLLGLVPYRTAYPLPDNTIPSGWGANIHFTHQKPGELDKMQRLGFRWVRMDLSWSAVERRKGEFDFSNYDVLLNDLDKAGMRAHLILDYGNSLYQEGAPTTEEAQRAFVRYASRVVKHFRRRGVIWEMWNEPNLAQFWAPAPDVGTYCDLALKVGKMIRKEAPEEWYVGPGVSGFDWAFLEGCFKRGLLKYFDGVTIHPYRQEQPETVADDWEKLRALIHEADPKAAPMLMSGEWGYSDAWKGQNPDKKAEYVIRQYLTNLACGVPYSVYYDWKNDGPDRAEPEHNFGIVTENLGDKPASLEMASFVREAEGFRLVGSNFEPNLWALGFKKGQDLATWIWLSKAHDAGSPMGLPHLRLVNLGEPGTGSSSIVLPTIPSRSKLKGIQTLARVLSHLPEQSRVSYPGELNQADQQIRRWLDQLEPLLRAHPGAGLETSAFDGNGPVPTEAKARPALAGRFAADFRPYGQPLVISCSVKDGVMPGVPLTRKLVLTPRWPLSIAPGCREGEAVLENPKGWRGRIGDLGVDGTPLQTIPLSSGRSLVDGDTVAARRTWRSIDSISPVLSAGGEGDFPPESTAAADSEGVWTLTTKFPSGWSYSVFSPTSKLITRDAKFYGAEVYGDGSGVILRCRFVDAFGETFQPNGIKIDWKGWRVVRFAVSPEGASSWGEPADGIMQFPVTLETLVLLDSPDRKPFQTSIKVRNFHLVK